MGKLLFSYLEINLWDGSNGFDLLNLVFDFFFGHLFLGLFDSMADTFAAEGTGRSGEKVFLNLLDVQYKKKTISA